MPVGNESRRDGAQWRVIVVALAGGGADKHGLGIVREGKGDNEVTLSTILCTITHEEKRFGKSSWRAWMQV